MNEVVEQCETCGCEEADKLKRVYDKINVRKTAPLKTSAASRVKEFIKDSKEILEQQKAEARDEHD